MTRLAEKLQLSLLLTRNTTRFLSRVSLSTLRLCKSLVSKTLAGLFSAMDHDYPFSSEGDDHLFEFDYSNSSRQNNYFSQPTATNSRGLFDDDDRQKVYLVPYRCVSFSCRFCLICIGCLSCLVAEKLKENSWTRIPLRFHFIFLTKPFNEINAIFYNILWFSETSERR